MLHVLAEVFNYSLPDPEGLERARQVVLNELYAGGDPRLPMRQSLWEMVYQVDPQRNPPWGLTADVTRLDVTSIAAWQQRCLQPSRGVLVLVGDVDRAQALLLVQRAFPASSPVPPLVEPPWSEPPQQGLRYAEVSIGAGPAQVLVGYPLPGMAHPDMPALLLIEELLKMDAPDLRPPATPPPDEVGITKGKYAGLFWLQVAVDPAATLAGIDGLEAIIAEIRARQVSDSKLDQARRRWLVAQGVQQADPQQRAATLALLWSWGLDERALGVAVEALTPPDLVRVATTWLPAGHRSLVVGLPSLESLETKP